MAEIKTINGHTLCDTVARDGLEAAATKAELDILAEDVEALAQQPTQAGHTGAVASQGMAFGIVDASDKAAFGVQKDGTTIIAKMEHIPLGAGRMGTFEGEEAPAFVICSPEGQMSELVIGQDGRVPDWVIGAWKKRLGLAQRVVCWGDSLTWGAGGDITGWHAVDYPGEVAKSCPCANMGVPGEDTLTIMARQGADPMLAPAGLTIPAARTAVQIAATGEGIPTVSGGLAYPLRQATAGVNPVRIAGVLGDLTKEATDAGTETIAYSFTRREAGEAVTLGTLDREIETLAMRTLRGGVACIWMGANGGWDGAVSKLVQQIEKMLEYGQYEDYLVLTLRELTDSQRPFLASAFEGHFVDLKAYLNQRGMMDAGILLEEDTPTNGIPGCLDAGDGLHLNYYGYKAIGGYVAETLRHRGMI